MGKVLKGLRIVVFSISFLFVGVFAYGIDIINPDAETSFSGNYNWEEGLGGALYLDVESFESESQEIFIPNVNFFNSVAKSSGGAVYIKGASGAKNVPLRFNAKVRDAVFSGNYAFATFSGNQIINVGIDNDIYLDNYSHVIIDPYEDRKVIMYGGIMGKKSNSADVSTSLIEKKGVGTFVLGGHVDYDGLLDVQEGVFNFVADEGLIGSVNIKENSILSMENAKINKISVEKIVVYGDIVLEVNLNNSLADTIEASTTITIQDTSKLFIREISQTDIQGLVETNSETKIGLMKAENGISGIFKESYYENVLMSMSNYGYGLVYDDTDKWLYLVIDGSKIVNDDDTIALRYEVLDHTVIASLQRFNLSSFQTVALLEKISNNSEIYGYSPEMDELFVAINSFLADYYPEPAPSNSFGNGRSSRGFSGATAQPLTPGLAVDKIDEIFTKLQGRSLTNMLIMGALENEGKVSSLYSKINKDNKKVWGQVYSDGTKFNSKDSIVGEFKSDGYGINAGIDLFENEGATGGVYVDYEMNKINQSDDSADMKDFQLGLYGGWFGESINIKANISGGWQKFDSIRDITIGKTYKKQPVADFDTYSVRFGSEAEYIVQVNKTINFRPFVGFHGGYVKNADIVESKGAGASLLIKADDYLKLVGVFGAAIGNDKTNPLTWDIKLYAGYTLAGNEAEYKVSFANTTRAGDLTNSGTQQADLVGGATLGLGYAITQTITIYTDLSADFGDDLFGYFATAGVKYKIGK